MVERGWGGVGGRVGSVNLFFMACNTGYISISIPWRCGVEGTFTEVCGGCGVESVTQPWGQSFPGEEGAAGPQGNNEKEKINSFPQYLCFLCAVDVTARK